MVNSLILNKQETFLKKRKKNFEYPLKGNEAFP